MIDARTYDNESNVFEGRAGDAPLLAVDVGTVAPDERKTKLAIDALRLHSDATGVKFDPDRVVTWYGRPVPGYGVALSPQRWEQEPTLALPDRVVLTFVVAAPEKRAP